jgi:hypothetical protein
MLNTLHTPISVLYQKQKKSTRVKLKVVLIFAEHFIGLEMMIPTFGIMVVYLI